MVKTIMAHNFLSWEKLEFNFETGVTLIQGFNYDDDTSEGSGKSAILNALTWGIYGKLPKDTKIDEVIRDGQKSCKVEIIFNDYIVTRSRKPNQLFITDSKGEVIKGKDIKDTQTLIEHCIGMTFDTFCQTNYFPQNYTKKFITATQEEKGKILSEIQNLELFDKARKETLSMLKIEKEKIDKYNNEINIIDTRIEGITNVVHTVKDSIRRKQEERTLRLKNLSVTEENLENAISKINDFLEKLPSGIIEVHPVDINPTKESIAEITKDRDALSAQLLSIDQQYTLKETYKSDLKFNFQLIEEYQSKIAKLADFIKNPTKICEMCGTLLEKADTSHAEKEILTYNSEIERLSKDRKAINVKVDNLEIPDKTELMSAILLLNNKIKELNNYLDASIKNNNQIELIEKQRLQTIEFKKSEITNLNNQLETIYKQKESEENLDFSNEDNKLGECELNLKKEIAKKEDLEQLQKATKVYAARLETLKINFKEIKSYVFNSMLNQLMVKTNNYLSELFEVPVQLMFHNEDLKITTEIKLDGQTRSLGLLSGGQFRRVCLSVDLALSDIVLSRKGSSLNLRILDEYFKDLSESSMEKCLKLLEKLGGTTILIEHNSIFKSIVDKTFEIELKDGISKEV